MTKITDPNGLVIELLQQGFQGHEGPIPEGHPIGAQATLAHITLRVSDIKSAADYFENRLEMRLMSVQPVGAHGFCLYFYAWSRREPLPDPDVKAVANREWLWRRPYTLIELQHLETAAAPVRRADADSCGFDGFTYADDRDEPSRHRLPLGSPSPVMKRRRGSGQAPASSSLRAWSIRAGSPAISTWLPDSRVSGRPCQSVAAPPAASITGTAAP